MQITVNETGARTLADARPMKIDGQNVYVVVGGGTASLMVAGRIVAERAATDMSIIEAQAWAVEYRTAMNESATVTVEDWDAVTVADEAAVAEATDPDAVYALAVSQVRAQADELLSKAEVAEAHGDGVYKVRTSDGKVRRFPAHDPRHPMNAAKSYRADAEILAAWTAQDESGYGQYVSDGTGDTDGWYAPLDRAAWKATLAR